MGGQNVGGLLDAGGVTWGWFQGGFKPTSRTATRSPVCGSAHFVAILYDGWYDHQMSPIFNQSQTPLDALTVVRFIEDNWKLGRVGGGSFDNRAGSLSGLFDFSHPDSDRLMLNPRPASAPSSKTSRPARTGPGDFSAPLR